ncbi:glycosyltransferase family 2 protein [Thiospirillum jenense]|uniref:Glycosyltransferase n=1 Tax=Thiospirillum jenense TaxID=1653858 RepID=A0A839H9A8_9GAMM|nr:glycosyltransferase [Thiospirillum jenense]MBB1125903.1 glycosyltransferase [Thiospirillum jenense]
MAGLFSVILATRNRPELFGDALNSVLNQTYQGFEIIVVDDGSDAQYSENYNNLFNSIAGERPDIETKLLRLAQRDKGHGQSYSLNEGSKFASNEFLCFLDDDDFWIEPCYLEQVANNLCDMPSIDLYMSNQQALLLGKPLTQPVWLENLPNTFNRFPPKSISANIWLVSVDNLMNIDGFCHLNCLVIRKKLFFAIGGMDENIRWECDRDLYLRAINQANQIIFNPNVVSHHRVPDKSKQSNMTTALSEVDRRLYQLRVFEKAVIYAKHPLIRNMAKCQLVYTLKHIAEQLFKSGNYTAGSHFGWQALGARFSFKWLAYLVVQFLKNKLSFKMIG